jgi:hypothetical protein
MKGEDKMREEYQTIEKDGFIAKIYQDEYVENPFDDWDSIG